MTRAVQLVIFFSFSPFSITDRACLQMFEDDMGYPAVDALSVSHVFIRDAPNIAHVVGFDAIYFCFKVEFDFVCAPRKLILLLGRCGIFFTRHCRSNLQHHNIFLIRKLYL